MTGRSRFVREHAVCWEMSPLRELAGGRVQQVGLELTLHAQSPRVDPSSSEAREMHATLHEIARQVLPQAADLAIEPYDAALHLRHETGWTAEVELRALIRSQGDSSAWSADAQRKQARAIAASLRELGIPQGVYRSAA